MGTEEWKDDKKCLVEYSKGRPYEKINSACTAVIRLTEVAMSKLRNY